MEKSDSTFIVHRSYSIFLFRPGNFRTVHVSGSSSEEIGTDDRWGQLYVSNSVAVRPTVSGTNFWVDILPGGLGTQQVVAAISDAAGNMAYATNEFFISVVTNGSYAYNSAGCLTDLAYSGADYSKELELEWNSQYQLVSVDDASSFVSYTYDILGRRVSRTENSNTVFYIYNGQQVVADLNESGNVLRAYTWGAGVDNLLSMTVYTSSETNIYFAIKDVQNSVHALVDGNGNIVERYEYDAWGRTSVFDANGNELTGSAIGNRYAFQGREIDWVTGFYYFRARWYDPVTGRWLSKDPIGISGGLNLYAFCGNNPVNKIDPFGLCENGAWWDNMHHYWRRGVDNSSDWMIGNAPWPVAGVVNGFMEIGMKTIDIPYNLGHFGEGTGRFISDPRTGNISGLIGDIGIVTDTLSGGLIPGGSTGLGDTIDAITDAFGDIASGVGAGTSVGDLFNGD